MALAINITDGRGLSNNSHLLLLLKKSKVMQYLLFISKAFNQLYITKNTKRFSFNSRCAMRATALKCSIEELETT